MKRIIYILLIAVSTIVLTTSMLAQNTKRAMRVFYNGEIVRSLDATKIDSINLHFTEVEDDNLNGGDESDTMEQLYVGVVAFNQRVFLKPITSDVAVVKTFINEQTNDKDQTSIAYAASRGNQLFEANDLPKFDKVYMLNFTDGFDNFSSRLWRDSIGRVVNKDYVYDTARYDLLQHAGLNSYALAFGEEAIKVEEQTKKLVLGTGKYYEAANASQLQPTFNEIAKSMLASAQNAVLQTNAEYYFASAPKKFQLIFTTKEGYTDIVYASMTGTPYAGYKLEIDRVANQYVSFDSPAYGKEDIATHKANIPLNNMKFIKDGEELQFKYQINILTRDGSLYAEDVEDASSSEEINKRIAVVLVLDCSTSMGDAFVPMKDAAVKFIETMQKMEVDTTKIYIPDVDVIWDLNGGTINTQLPSSITSSYYNIPTPIRESCNFLGWYDNPNGTGSKYSRLYRGHKGILYAVWETPPTLSSSKVGAITHSSATVYGNVVSDGGAEITERGVVYSTSPNPTTADRKVQCDSGVGSFECTLTSLSPGTTYYVRSYAVNKIGVAYGEEVQFVTPAIIPSLTICTVSDITASTATIISNVVNTGGAEITEHGFVYSSLPNPTLETSNVYKSSDHYGWYQCTLTSLDYATVYYVRSYAVNEVGVAYGEEISFTTLAILPTVGTSSVSNVTSSSATISSNVVSDGGANIIERGVVYSTSSNPTTSNSKIVSGSGLGSFECKLTSLNYATTYYVRSYAVNEIGVAYGEEISFTTLAILPTIGTSLVSNITSSSATISSSVTSDGGATVTERGVVYSNSANPTIDNATKVVIGSGSFACSLSSLNYATTYYARSYAVNEVGVAYGAEVTFTTLAILPTIGASSVSDITSSSAVVSSIVVSDGGASITERGLVYGTTSNPTISDVKVSVGNGVGDYEYTLDALSYATVYYVRSYAVNEIGVAYGEEISFTTLAILPTIGTSLVSNITSSSATISSSVVSDGGAAVTERGVVYSTSSNPTISDSKVQSGNGAGSFSRKLSALKYATTYYVRSYAVNEIGVAYGEEISFTTLAILPTMGTSSVSDITSSSATISSSVTSDGGATVTERGVVYSTSSNPTTSNSKIVSGSGLGSFECKLTSLNYATTYYVRSYAKNSAGIVYGNEITFTTSPILPTVSASTVTNLTSSSATISSSVTSDGGATVTERGVVYSTSQNPTTSNSKIVSGSGLGSFECKLTSLNYATTYYARAYAINSVGTAYGEEVSFTTNDGTDNGYEYVDLGLSVKWATCNVGASKPEEYGDYFAWGETQPKSTYSWSSYKWCNGSSTTLTKYNTDSSYGTVDNKTVLDLFDDAARANWGGSWRMPTGAELTELREQCTWTWTTQNGVYGYKVTSKKSGYTNKSIFLPVAGYRNDSSLNGAGGGRYWSSSLITGSPNVAYDLLFDSSVAHWYGHNRYYGQSVRPILQEPTIPIITTTATTQITATTAVIGGNVTNEGNAIVTERGVVYSTSSNPTISNSKVQSGSGAGGFSCKLSALKYATTYYARSYAVNEVGVAYGEEISFTTLAILPTMGISSVSGVTSSSATISSSITSDGGATVTERGIVYSTSSNPTTSNSKIVSGSGLGSFECKLTSLNYATTYYVRSYAKNSAGTVYGNEITFTTSPILPTVSASTVTNLTSSSATISSSVTSDGGATVTERGIVYSISSNPTIDNATKVVIGSGNFACSLSSLSYATTYYVRSYAVNEIGVAYGEEISFTTLAILPTMGTSSVSGVTSSSATISSSVTSDGGATVTERGVVYSTSSNPTTSNSKIVSGSGLGEFKCTIKSLSYATTYYVRAYAKNSAGTVYGNEITFTTSPILPTVSASTVTKITSSSATISSSVTSDGGATVTERGVVYSTSQNPTTSNSKIVSGSGLGSFTCALSSLSPGSTYYVRSYAVNEIGVAYGEEVSFKALAVLPTISASTVTNITYSSAVVSSKVLTDGGATVTERGVVYDTSSNPTISNSKVTCGSGIGSFTCNLTSLQPNTTYYVRTYAINSAGTAYGAQGSFTTDYEYVDLGLSVKWATCNVGANQPEEIGDYFAWGETTTKSTYYWSTYKWCNGSSTTLTKYNTDSSYGTVDNKIVLDLSDDVARVNWGGSWRMPTHEEQEELRAQCTWTLTTQNGVYGCKVTSKKNGNSIFLPATRVEHRPSNIVYVSGFYWSSSLNTGNPVNAWRVYFGPSGVDRGYGDRYSGYPVRPVCP